MSPEKVVYTLLAAALGTDARVYAQARPEDDPLPAVVLSKISDVDISRSLTTQKKWRARIQCTAMAATPEAAKTLAVRCADVCTHRTGSIGGINVDRILVAGYGPDSYDRMVETYSQPVDITVVYDR